MLEVSSKHVLCGVIKVNGTFTEVYACPETGDVAFEDPYQGIATLIGEITVDDPINLKNKDNLIKAVSDAEDGNIVGMVMSKSGVIVIYGDDTAELRELVDLSKSKGKRFSINTDMDYEFEE